MVRVQARGGTAHCRVGWGLRLDWWLFSGHLGWCVLRSRRERGM